MDMSLYKFGGTVPYRNIDYLGRCYDFIKINPLDLSERSHDGGGCLSTCAVDIAPEHLSAQTSDQRILIPNGTYHLPEARATSATRTEVWSTAHDFCDSFKKTISGGFGIAGMFSFSASREFSRLEKETTEAGGVVTLVQSYVEDCSILLKEDFGKELGLGQEFVQAVRDLKAEDQCVGFIKKFGTHYAHEVVFGGRMYQRLQMSREAHRRYQEKGVDIAASAEFTFKKASASAKAGTSNENVQEIYSDKEVTVDDLRWVGGTPDTDLDAWLKSVRDDPKPMRLGLRPLYDLLTKEFFKDISDILTRRDWLEKAVEKYVHEQGKFRNRLEPLVDKLFVLRYQGYGEKDDPLKGKELGISLMFGPVLYILGLKGVLPGFRPMVWRVEPARGKLDGCYLAGYVDNAYGWLGVKYSKEVEAALPRWLLRGDGNARALITLVPAYGKSGEYYLRVPASTDDDSSGPSFGLGILGSGNSKDAKLPKGLAMMVPRSSEPRFLSTWKLESVYDE